MFPADRGPTNLFERLRDPQLYAAAAERVRARAVGDPARPLAAEGPWLHAVADLSGLARALAREVGSLAYRFQPMVVRSAWIRGQLRTLSVPAPLDEIVLHALAIAVTEAFDPYLSARVFSYRRGRSSLQAIAELLAFVRGHCARSGERQAWGLYVLRRDVRGYGDAIASGPESRLWPLVTGALAQAGHAPSEAQLRWLQTAFRPAVEGEEASSSVRGIPTGSPLQPAACNLYLGPIDRLLEAVPGGFYARYGDDILFAHPDPDRTLELARRLDAELASLALEWSREKCADLFFNLAGRRPALPSSAFRGAASLEYLGFRIDFHGVIGLKRIKARALLRDLTVRLAASDRLLREVAPDERARDLCAIANAALDPDHAGANPAAAALRYIVSDRAQLRDLDYKIALLLAQQLSGRRGVRAFRSHPPARLRGELGLCSLARARNRAGRHAAAVHG